MQSKKSSIFTLRLPNDLRSQLEEISEKEGRSLANLIVFFLREAVNDE